MAYNGNSSKIVSSSFLYSTLQTFYTKIKGLLNKKLDFNIHIAQGEAGVNGCVAFAKIKISRSYVNRPIEFTLIRRGSVTPCRVSVTFKNLDGVDPDVQELSYCGDNYGVFINKIDTSTWLLCYRKSEPYDSITIAKTHIAQDGVEITYVDTFMETKPADNVINAKLGYNVGYSQTSTTADTATKLKTARTIQTNLSSTSSTSFDGSSNVTPGITGVLPVANGGTGQTGGRDSANYFINALATGASKPSDEDYFISQYVDGGETTTTYHRRPIRLLWEYIKDKTDKLYSLSSHTHNKSDVSDLNIKLTNEDLDTIKNVGFYYGGGENGVLNKPTSVDAFGLIVFQSANGWYTQLLYASNLGKQLYTRWYDGSTWTNWVKEVYIKNLSISGNNITLTKTDGTTKTLNADYIPLSGSTSITGALRTTGELQSTTPNGLRIAYGGCGAILRNDGNYTYLLLTENGDPYGSWNDLRPINIDNSTGFVTFSNGLKGTLTGNADSATNADKLDGYHGDNYMLHYGNYGASYFGSNDLNKWTRCGSFAIQSGCANAPADRGEDTWGTILVVRGTSDRITQYVTFWNESGQPLWYRCLNGSSWTSWTKVRDGGNANTATTSTTSSFSHNLNSTGFGNGTLTYLQTSGDFYDNTGWCHYIIANHGSGDSYYNHTIALPFWDAPMYQRQAGSTGARSGWQQFYTTENLTYGTQSLTPGTSSLKSGHIYLQYE